MGYWCPYMRKKHRNTPKSPKGIHWKGKTSLIPSEGKRPATERSKELGTFSKLTQDFKDEALHTGETVKSHNWVG